MRSSLEHVRSALARDPTSRWMDRGGRCREIDLLALIEIECQQGRSEIGTKATRVKADAVSQGTRSAAARSIAHPGRVLSGAEPVATGSAEEDVDHQHPEAERQGDGPEPHPTNPPGARFAIDHGLDLLEFEWSVVDQKTLDERDAVGAVSSCPVGRFGHSAATSFAVSHRIHPVMSTCVSGRPTSCCVMSVRGDDKPGQIRISNRDSCNISRVI